jgi:hypothetical protein
MHRSSLHSLLLCSCFIALAQPTIAADPKPNKPTATEDAPPPKPVEVKSLAVNPKAIDLKGGDDTLQLVLTADLGSGRVHDLTGDVKYEVADSKIVRVSSTGRVVPLANGKTEITIQYGSHSIKVPVSASAVDENLPINFGNQIVPIFTKLGCNSGGCHGKASGQNGFKLSLLGFEPDVDYSALVKEARGRRLFPASPENSLLLLKASGMMAHAGGKRMDVGSDEYKLIRRWIGAGVPFGKPTDPTLTKITIFPDHRSMSQQARQQLAVLAHYSDGSVEDITRRTQYESNDLEVAIVDSAGLVRSQAFSGEAAIMARYQGQVNVFRATVPLPTAPAAYKFEPKTVVDHFTLKKWQELNIAPSELCTDEQFIRRVSLDIAGTLPTPTQMAHFLADADPNKRDKLIDSLLESPEYSYYFANKWADILKIKRGRQQQQAANRAYGTFAFHDWVRESIASDKPYGQFAREIIVSVGDEVHNPTSVWFKDLLQPEQISDDLAQVFLGIRIQCAQCHHHPYEKWSQDDYWGMAAFFGRMARKNIPTPGQVQGQQNQRQALYVKATGNVTNKKTGKPAIMKVLDGDPAEVASSEDPRHKLVDWMVEANNPFFARSVANRYWAHFFGRGIVVPLDDMRVTNPPSNPELLDALAKDLIEHKYSLKDLVKTICKSRTYQLSSAPNDANKHDKQSYARYYPKRMTAEVLFDAVAQVTNSPTNFPGLPTDVYAPRRAIMLPDESFQSYFLDVFGRPQRLSACECERVTEANLAQVLHLLNSDEVQNKVSRNGGRADALAKDPRPDDQKIEELFMWALGRKPSEKQMELAQAQLEKYGKNKKQAYENMIWAFLNVKEFSFNH